MDGGGRPAHFAELDENIREFTQTCVVRWSPGLSCKTQDMIFISTLDALFLGHRYLWMLLNNEVIVMIIG